MQAAGGELGALIRSFDWSVSPLGAPDAWPQSLRSIVALLLESPSPMFLAWGPQLAFVYNDAYRPFLGRKHPALGKPFAQIWPEIWSEIEPLTRRALAGDAMLQEDMQLFMERSGYLEETYYSFSYSPMRDESGAVAGLFCTCTDTTAQVLGERRQRLLARLADIAARVRRPEEARRECLGALADAGEDVPAALLVDPDDGSLLSQGCVGDEALARRLLARTRHWALAPAGEEIDLDALPLQGARSHWDDPLRTASLLPVPRREASQPPLLLLLAHNPRRALDADYRLFLARVATGVAAALSSAEAFAAESARAETLSELRREAERQKRLYETLLDATPDLVYVFDLDYRFSYANQALLEMWGRSLDESLGRSLLELGYEPWHASLHERELDQVLETRARIRGEVGFPHATLGERIYDYIFSPVLDEEGRVEAVAGTTRDITDIKRAEAALARRTAQYEALVNAAPLGIFLVDGDFRLAAVNPRALPAFGQIPGLIGRDFATIMHTLWPASFAEQVIARFRHTLESGEPFNDPEMIQERRDNGAFEYFDWRISRVPLPHGGFGVVCYFRDISGEVRARQAIEASEEALREADRRKNEFLATLAHELRNPLAPLQSSLDLLQAGEPNPALLDRLRDIMRRQTRQLSALVDDLLDIARITRGKLELRRQRVELTDVVNMAMETSLPHLNQAGHSCAVELPQEPLLLDGDPKRLVQVLSNLLNNAAQYTPAPGRIGLSAQREGDTLRLAVRDSGIGIPAERQGDIFEMFTQIESAERGGQGLGIGLTLSRLLVELHGGRIAVHSGGAGQGSEFVVWLPLAGQAAASPAPPAAKPAAERSRSHTVLVVDDNQEAAETLGMLIGLLGHQVVTAGNGLEALDKAEALRPDLVVMDLGMPLMDGYEAARRLRQRDWGAQLQLVALTGWGQDEDRRRTSEAGFDAHLVKPVGLETLRAVLAGLDTSAQDSA